MSSLYRCSCRYNERGFYRRGNKNIIVFVSPDYPARVRNDCYGKKLLSLHNKNLGLPMELEDSFAPFLFIMDKDLCVKYLHIHNKPLPRLTLIYLEEIKKMW